ncbi:hsp70-binding protein 1 [Betta splendens]|uniref:Hsp70-binding protein 1 n=1 Tax=Betta splendens TaxID=158456 RepID=A0A6P7NCQ4_BETSP|nr:hsp70-binding protein 1 [Betta splendens]
MAEGRDNRRYPQNLQGVLQLAVEAGSATEGPAPPEPMSEERKTWLREALADICKGQTDEVEQMKQCLAVLRGEGTSERQRDGEDEEARDEEDEDEREAAFEMLSELCENLDNARDLMILGGLDLCVSQYLCHTQSGLRWRAAQLIASCAQNMPQVQLHLLSIGTLPKLLQLIDSDPHSTVRVKALYAISCLVREQEAGLQAFLSSDGFSVLMRGMQSENERLRTKSAFLLLNLLTAHPEQKDTVASMGMVQQLVSVLRTPHSPFHEHVLGALCCLVEDCAQGLKDCMNPALGLEELLKQRITELQGKEENQEELDYCTRLRVLCFHGRQSDDSGMDR